MFGTDEKGRIIYYPFRKPGEAYYIDENQFKKIERYIIFFSIPCVVIMISLQILRSNEWLPIHYFLTFQTILFGPALILLYLRVKKFVGTLEPYPYKPTKIPAFFYGLLCLLFLQVLTIAAAINAFYLAPVFIGMLIVWYFTYSIILSIAAYRTIKPVLAARKS